jgi:hypothetical protein
MVEQVTKRKLYHVTETKPYKNAFTAGEIVRIGGAYNPFFSFYELAREYPVTENGATVLVKAKDWLRRVRDKTILTTPDIHARIAVEVAEHYVMLCRELLMEEIRREEFGSKPPSRQSCLFACETVQEARDWIPLVGSNGLICELNCTGTIHRADSRLLLGDSEPLSITRDRARAYWRGEMSEHPRAETLVVGNVVVSAVGL